jgi:hypothetical protein
MYVYLCVKIAIRNKLFFIWEKIFSPKIWPKRVIGRKLQLFEHKQMPLYFKKMCLDRPLEAVPTNKKCCRYIHEDRLLPAVIQICFPRVGMVAWQLSTTGKTFSDQSDGSTVIFWVCDHFWLSASLALLFFLLFFSGPPPCWPGWPTSPCTCNGMMGVLTGCLGFSTRAWPRRPWRPDSR